MSLAGVSEFHLSFDPIGTITSLNSGLPSRETWTQPPDSTVAPFASRTSDFCRLAAAQTPTTEFRELGSVGLAPPTVRSVFGTLIAIVCTPNALVALTPGALAMLAMCRL